MRLSIFVILAAYLILALASPKGGGGKGGGVRKEKPKAGSGGDSNNNECGVSTIECETSIRSPLISDCLSMLDSNNTPDHWKIRSAGHHKLMYKDSCAVEVQISGSNIAIVPWVGIDDIRDVVKGLTSKCGSNGLVGGKGGMKCGAELGISGQITWAVYYNCHRRDC